MADKVGTPKMDGYSVHYNFDLLKLQFACLVSAYGNDPPHECLLANLKSQNKDHAKIFESTLITYYNVQQPEVYTLLHNNRIIYLPSG